MKIFKRVKRLFKQRKPRIKTEPLGKAFDRESEKQRYPGSQKRQYRVYLPTGYRNNRPAPLVMVLHGCLQDHLAIQAISDFDAVAEQHDFIVVYPFVTRYTDIRTRNCWGWWRAKHISPGSGEVEDLWRIVEKVSAEFSIDARRIHIAGLSSGGCMAVAALTVHANRFASGAAVAALAYGETPSAIIKRPFATDRLYMSITETTALMEKARNHNRTAAPLFIVHSHDDDAVHIKAAENLRDSWLAYFSADMQPHIREHHHSTEGTPWVHTRYGKRFSNSIVETVFLHGPGHGWYGGAPGKFSYPTAPPTAELMWDFFSEHALVSAIAS
jgi:poly(hydroxyalkanoate) depolymerase family esterase